MSKEHARAPRKTIGDFGREIDEFAGFRQLGTTLPALTRTLSSFLDDATVATYLYDEEDDEFVLRGSTQHLHVNGEAQRFRSSKTLPGLAIMNTAPSRSAKTTAATAASCSRKSTCSRSRPAVAPSVRWL